MDRFEDLPSSNSLTKEVIGLAMKVHRVLGAGFLELVYANALAVELERTGIPFEREHHIAVTYEDVIVGDYIADFILRSTVVVELKAVESLTINHSLQLVNYLAATRFDLGLLLNFGAKSLQFKTKTRLYAPSPSLSQFSNSVNSV
jgi:GxxExxY protein